MIQATGLDEREAWKEVVNPTITRADGKFSLLGKNEDDDVVQSTQPKDDATYFEEVDGKMVFKRNGEVVGECLTPAKEKEVKAEAQFEKDVNGWQKLQQRLQDKRKGAIPFPLPVGDDDEEHTWWFARPSMRTIRLLNALKSKIKIDEETGEPIDLDDWLEPVCKSLFRLLLVKGKFDYEPFFASDDEAEEFICDPDFGDTCLALFNALRDVYSDFLAGAQGSD